MRKLLFILLLFVLLILGIIICFNALMIYSVQPLVQPVEEIVWKEGPAERLAQAIRLQTVEGDSSAFFNFHQLSKKHFPKIYNDPDIEVQFFGQKSVVYKWTGRNPNLKPILLVSNLDVKDPDLKTIPEWTYNPFMGKLADDQIWGCGSRQGKAGAMAILESVNRMLKEEILPNRTLYLVFTHDQQRGGTAGAKPIAWAFQQAKMEFEFILGYASGIHQGNLLGTEADYALLGITEHNLLSVFLKSDTDKNIQQFLEKLSQNPMTIDLQEGATKQFVRTLLPELGFSERAVFANTWMWGFGGWAKSKLQKDSLANRLLRTSFEVQASSNNQEKILNCYIHPNETPEEIIAYLKEISKGLNILIEPQPSLYNTVNIAPADGYGYEVLQTTTKQIFPEMLTIPAINPKPSDTRYFQTLSHNVYYFAPVYQLEGIDERISNREYEQMLSFYYQLLKNTTN